MKTSTVVVVIGIAVASVAAIVLLRKAGSFASQAVDATLTAINPLNPDNLAYSGVNAVGGALVTDPAGPGKNADGSWTLGGWIYDVTHSNPMQ
jgi:hypothetical protein